MKVYSKHDVPVTKVVGAEGVQNMLYTDGVNTPSEFSGNDYDVSLMVLEGETPPDLHDISTHELECELAEIMMNSITTLDDHVEISGHYNPSFNGNYTF